MTYESSHFLHFVIWIKLLLTLMRYKGKYLPHILQLFPVEMQDFSDDLPRDTPRPVSLPFRLNIENSHAHIAINIKVYFFVSVGRRV